MRSIPSFKERRLEWPVRALNPVITFASETTIAITVPSLGNATSSLTNIRLKHASLSLHSSQRFCYEVSNLKCPSCSEPLYYSNNRFECVNWESNWTPARMKISPVFPFFALKLQASNNLRQWLMHLILNYVEELHSWNQLQFFLSPLLPLG